MRLVGAAGQPAFVSGWSNFGSPHAPAGFYKDRGRVYLQGTVKKSTVVADRDVIFTLPAGYIPAVQSLFASLSANVSCRVDVNMTGEVVVTKGGNSAYVSLNGLSFRI